MANRASGNAGDGEGGKKVCTEIFGAGTRSQNICPLHLIRVPRVRVATKLLRKKEE